MARIKKGDSVRFSVNFLRNNGLERTEFWYKRGVVEDERPKSSGISVAWDDGTVRSHESKYLEKVTYIEVPEGILSCAQCGAAFTAKKSNARYCSDSCRTVACRDRRAL